MVRFMVDSAIDSVVAAGPFSRVELWKLGNRGRECTERAAISTFQTAKCLTQMELST